MERDNLHPTQQKLLRLIEENKDTPLSQRDLQEALNLSSVSVVQHHLKQLEKRGFLRRNPSNPRDFTIVDSRFAYLNLYGQAECGPSGSVLEGDPIATIPISTELIRNTSNGAFLVRANGDSMKPRIYPGDIVIANISNYADDEDIVVCVDRGQTLIKRILKVDGNIALVSLNDEYEPFFASEDFRVEGVVVGVISFNI